jgi:hypothetical protein
MEKQMIHPDELALLLERHNRQPQRGLAGVAAGGSSHVEFHKNTAGNYVGYWSRFSQEGTIRFQVEYMEASGN